QSGTLHFANGQTSNTIKIPIAHDAVDEGNETVIIKLANPQPTVEGASLLTPNVAVLTIMDNDVPGKIQFSSSAYSVNAASGATSVTLTLKRMGGTASGVSVHCTMTDGTAIGGTDYDNTPQDVTFASSGTAATIQVLAIPVSQSAAGAKTFTVSL